MQRLSRVARAYEMPVGKMLTHILITALEELEVLGERAEPLRELARFAVRRSE